MAPNSQKKYKDAFHWAWPFLLWLLVILFALFDFKYNERLKEFRINNVTSFITPTDLAEPTSELVTEEFIKPIQSFEKPDTLVLLGNSTIAGTGTLDRGFLNRQLSENSNVINAGLGGQDLRASTGLAILGLDEAIKSKAVNHVDIVAAYTSYRLYVVGDYWDYARSIGSLCRKADLTHDVEGCTSLPTYESLPEFRANTERWLLGSMRCMISSKIFSRWLEAGQPWCAQLYSLTEDNPEFVSRHRRRMEGVHNDSAINIAMMTDETKRSNFFDDWKFQQSAKNTPFSNEVMFVTNADWRKDAVLKTAAKISVIETFLKKNRIPYGVHFFLISDPPNELQENLDRGRMESLAKGRSEFVAGLKSAKPNWHVYDLLPFAVSDYYDVGHLIESGQAKLATLIKESVQNSRTVAQKELK